VSGTALSALARKIGAEFAAPHADDVDVQSRFPHEAIGALKDAGALSAFVPVELGGMGCSMRDLAAMCEALGEHCSATGMVFAMHQIQVGSIVRHCGTSEYFRAYLRELVEKQLLIASVTSEVGVGGDMRSSVCAVERDGCNLSLAKDATTISYGGHADDLLITARREAGAPPSDQVLVLARKADLTLEQTGTWDTLGMRGTCSHGFKLRATGHCSQILGEEFATIASHTMVPFSHILWAGLWLGIASGAISRARAFVRAEARKKPGTLPPTAIRLAEAMNALQTMRASVYEVARDCEERMADGIDTLSTVAFALKMNNLKISASQQVFQIVYQAMQICGISAYKNNTPFSLGRPLRDSLSAALMVGNDRIYATNAQLALILKDNT
jgi:acyl-CoA dehydrogenase